MNPSLIGGDLEPRVSTKHVSVPPQVACVRAPIISRPFWHRTLGWNEPSGLFCTGIWTTTQTPHRLNRLTFRSGTVAYNRTAFVQPFICALAY